MSNLNGTNNLGEYGLEDQILYNVMTFMRYGLLELGGYQNITTGLLDQNGNDQSRLYPVSKKGSTDYTIYTDVKHDWVWEPSVSLKTSGFIGQPIIPTGILVNGVATTTGYFIDYAGGRVVFADPQLPATIIQIPHSRRTIQTYPQDSNEYRKLVYDWADRASVTGLQHTNENYAYLPALFINVKGYETIRGTEQGSRDKFIKANLEFDIFTTNPFDRKKITDICYMLETKAFWMYDVNRAPFPLNYRGELNPSGLTWPDLVVQYGLSRTARFREDFRSSKINDQVLPLMRSRAYIGLEMDVVPF